jgi:hypothetical protein
MLISLLKNGLFVIHQDLNDLHKLPELAEDHDAGAHIVPQSTIDKMQRSLTVTENTNIIDVWPMVPGNTFDLQDLSPIWSFTWWTPDEDGRMPWVSMEFLVVSLAIEDLMVMTKDDQRITELLFHEKPQEIIVRGWSVLGTTRFDNEQRALLLLHFSSH